MADSLLGKANPKKKDDMTRLDGTRKHAEGWKGPYRNKVEGGTMTEVSVSFDDVLGGKLIPLIVPTTTRAELEQLSKMKLKGNAKNFPQSMRRKAIQHAIMRDKKGLSPFRQEKE
jgi:hypothetical protein